MSKSYWVPDDGKINPQTVQVINDFLASLKQVNRSEHTIAQHCLLLKKFFLDCPKPLGDLIPDDLLGWLTSQYGNKKPGTIDKSIDVLSKFFRFCLNEGHVERLLVKSRWRPRIPQAIPKYLEKSEQAMVKLQAEQLSLRDRVIYEFLLSSGCRKAELFGLDLKDVDVSHRTATVVGKGRKIRQVHFSETCAILLKKYLETHPEDTDTLFINKSGVRLSKQWIYEIASGLGKKAGLSRQISPHCFRHTFATNLLAKGAGLDFIASELGHADLNTARTYARLPNPKMVALYRKYMG